MNFISTFDELNKLYEDFTTPSTKKLKAEVIKNLPKSYAEQINKFNFVIAAEGGVTVDQKAGTISVGSKAVNSGAHEIAKIITTELDRLTTPVDEACTKEALTEAAEDEIEIVDDEAPVEEVPVEEEEVEAEPKQVIIECDKCGALVIVDEADIVVDEESDLVNVKDECKFCEEKEGFKIVGVVAPYEVAEVEEPIEEVVEESLNNSELLKEIEKTNELKTEHESEYLTLNEEAEDLIDEDLADLYRKTFDKPASTKTQQAWEDELNGEMGEISDKRRKHLEKKFQQQRDWEARHTDELAELLDVKPNISLSLSGGEGNDVDVLS